MPRVRQTPVTRQLPLGVQLRDDATLDNFLFPPGSEILLPELEGMLHKGGSHLLYLHGIPLGKPGRRGRRRSACCSPCQK